MTRHMTLRVDSAFNVTDTSEECSAASHVTEGGSGESFCRRGSLDSDQRMCLLMHAW